MAGYYKDHKPLREDNEQLGSKMQPVCGSVEGSNGPQTHKLAEILSFLGAIVDREVGGICLSSEEMYGAIEMYNRAALRQVAGFPDMVFMP